MRILALVTARGGSKRVPGKNIRLLGGVPLLVWSVNVVKDVAEVCDTLVSTDDEVVAKVAREAGALVPWLRPAEISTNSATSLDVALHALDWYEAEKGKVDGLLLLQPTSPFRTRDTVMRGIAQFCSSQQRPVVGVSPAPSHPLWCFRMDGDGLRPFCDEAGLHLRSQDLPPAYVVNGAFYLITPEDLRKRRSFYENMAPLIIEEPKESIDIDTEWDWKMAEAIQALDRTGEIH